MRCPKCGKYVDDNDNVENGFFCIECNHTFIHNGLVCPNCGSEDIEGREIEPEGVTAATRQVSCNLCNCYWIEVLKVCGFIDLTQG